MAIIPQLAFDFEGQSPKLCECGCGLPAPIATKTVKRMGWVKGQPKRFRHGHYAKAAYAHVAVRTEKRCPKCETVKPLDDFCRNRWSTDGHNWMCKLCSTANPDRLIERWQVEQKRQETGLKRCSQCQEWKEPEQFGRMVTAADGKQSACRECLRLSGQQRVQHNRAEIRLRENQACAKRRDQVNARARQREATKTPEQREARRKQQSLWQKLNPELVRANSARRRARVMNAPRIEDVDTALIIARDKSTCYLCGGVFPRKKIAIDHVIPLVRGGSHTYDNLRVTCKTCNSRKHDKLPSECSWAISTSLPCP